MTYEEIQRRLREAGRLVDQGNVAEADAMIREMLGKGMTGRDLASNLTEGQRTALRAHAKSPSKRPKSRAKPKKKANPRRAQTHKDVVFLVEQGLFEARHKDGNEAAAFAIARSISTGSPVTINVLVNSRAGAEWYGGDASVQSYEKNPFASVHEQIEVRAKSRGRIA